MRLSACNQLEGTVKQIIEGALGCLVSIDTGIFDINAYISLDALNSLDLTEGEKAYAIFSSVDVKIAEYGAIVPLGYSSGIAAFVDEIIYGDIEDQLVLVLGDRQVVKSIVSRHATASFSIKEGGMVYAMVSPLSVMVGKGSNIDKTSTYHNQLGSENNPYKLSDGEPFCLTTSNEKWFEFSASGAVDIEYHFPCPSEGHVWSSYPAGLSGKKDIYQFQLAQDPVVECNEFGYNIYTFLAKPKCAGELRVIGRQHQDGPNYDSAKWLWVGDGDSGCEIINTRHRFRIFFEKEEVPALLTLLRDETFIDYFESVIKSEFVFDSAAILSAAVGFVLAAGAISLVGKISGIVSFCYDFFPSLLAYVEAHYAAETHDGQDSNFGVYVTLSTSAKTDLSRMITVERWDDYPAMFGPVGSRGEFIDPDVDREELIENG